MKRLTSQWLGTRKAHTSFLNTETGAYTGTTNRHTASAVVPPPPPPNAVPAWGRQDRTAVCAFVELRGTPHRRVVPWGSLKCVGATTRHRRRNRSGGPTQRLCGICASREKLIDAADCQKRTNHRGLCPNPPLPPNHKTNSRQHSALIGFALQCSKSKQCTEVHGYDHMPVSRGYMRAQYPLLMAPTRITDYTTDHNQATHKTHTAAVFVETPPPLPPLPLNRSPGSGPSQEC